MAIYMVSQSLVLLKMKLYENVSESKWNEYRMTGIESTLIEEKQYCTGAVLDAVKTVQSI